MSSEIELVGHGPFHLPLAQTASAEGHQGNGVTATFRVLANDGREFESVSIQMTADVALELADRLTNAAADSKKPVSG